MFTKTTALAATTTEGMTREVNRALVFGFDRSSLVSAVMYGKGDAEIVSATYTETAKDDHLVVTLSDGRTLTGRYFNTYHVKGEIEVTVSYASPLAEVDRLVAAYNRARAL